MGCFASSKVTDEAGVAKINDTTLSDDFHERYLLGIKLGLGAFAQVRVAAEVNNAAKIEKAVKIIDLRDKGEDPVSGQATIRNSLNKGLEKTARKEVACWGRLGSHPNCVCMEAAFFCHSLCYVVMEKCNSGLLQALESMPELTERGLGNIFAQMLLGICHCHGARVVHRDIKPDNFIVGGKEGQTIKLGDYGLSAMLVKREKTSGTFGTAPFMSPEMLKGLTYDVKTDVWSFAVVVYVLLFGNFPYMPKVQNTKAMKRAIIDGTPDITPSFVPSQRAVGPTGVMYSNTALTFVKSLLDREPDARPSAMDALAMPWMVAALQGCHMTGAELPSLRQMLHAAKRVGAFEVRNKLTESPLDKYLNELQESRHGRPLPAAGKKKADSGSTTPPSPDKGKSFESDSSSGTTKSMNKSSDTDSVFSGWSKGTSSAQSQSS